MRTTSAHPPSKHELHLYDANGDGRVSIAEITAAITHEVPLRKDGEWRVPEGYVPGQVLTVLVPPLAPGPTGGAAPLPSIEALVHEIKSGICCQRTMIGIMFAIQIFGILMNTLFGIHFTMFKVALVLVLAGVYAYCECPAKRTV